MDANAENLSSDTGVPAKHVMPVDFALWWR